MSMQEELKAIWDKYEPQRADERELRELNTKREQIGLPRLLTVQDANNQNRAVGALRTWRDNMDDALLSCVKRHLDPVVPT